MGARPVFRGDVVPAARKLGAALAEWRGPVLADVELGPSDELRQARAAWASGPAPKALESVTPARERRRAAAASSATAFRLGVVMYITPSTTTGVHSIVRPGEESPVCQVQATFSRPTLSRLIWSSVE